MNYFFNEIILISLRVTSDFSGPIKTVVKRKTLSVKENVGDSVVYSSALNAFNGEIENGTVSFVRLSIFCRGIFRCEKDNRFYPEQYEQSIPARKNYKTFVQKKLDNMLGRKCWKVRSWKSLLRYIIEQRKKGARK